MKQFVDDAQKPDYYGKYFTVLNVHNIIHLTDDIDFHQNSLNELSAFCFESYLSTVTNSFRSPTNLVAQYCRRSFEKENFVEVPNFIPPELEILKRNIKKEIVRLKCKIFTFSKEHPDRTILLQNNDIAQIVSLKEQSNSSFIECRKFNRRSAFSQPCDSADLFIWEVSNSPAESSLKSLLEI